MQRTIITIDEEACDGCGLCVQGCAEGALAIIDGKARLVSETYCDGLGACLGECPRGAIRTEVREADAFDQGAVDEHLRRLGRTPAHPHRVPAPAAVPAEGGCACGDAPAGPAGPASHAHGHGHGHGGGCPGSRLRLLAPPPAARPAAPAEGAGAGSQLRSWPVQLALVPPQAPTLAAMAARLGLSPDRFTRVFRARTGLAPRAFLVQLRLERARTLLADSALSVQAVGEACGFNDPSFFVRHFTAHQGLSPGAWRRGRRHPGGAAQPRR